MSLPTLSSRFVPLHTDIFVLESEDASNAAYLTYMSAKAGPPAFRKACRACNAVDNPIAVTSLALFYVESDVQLTVSVSGLSGPVGSPRL